MNYLFGFDLKRCNEVAIEVAEEMNVMRPGIDWDHMDGNEFFDLAHKALHIVEVKNPQLFL